MQENYDAMNNGFDAGLTELEAIVQKMERGSIPLEQAITLFERGTKLAAQLDAILKGYEQRVVLIQTGAAGEPVEVSMPAV